MPTDLDELLRLLEDPAPMAGDLHSAMNTVQDSLDRNLGLRLRQATKARQESARSHPPREAALLRALSLYTAGGTAEMLTQTAQTLTMLSAYQDLQRDLEEAKKKAQAPPGPGPAASSRYRYRSSAAESQPAADSTPLASLLLTLAFLDRL